MPSVPSPCTQFHLTLLNGRFRTIQTALFVTVWPSFAWASPNWRLRQLSEKWITHQSSRRALVYSTKQCTLPGRSFIALQIYKLACHTNKIPYTLLIQINSFWGHQACCPAATAYNNNVFTTNVWSLLTMSSAV